MDQQFKYFAFISYNSHDAEWGKRVQRKLEHYRMPSTLCSRHGWKSRTPINPVFFAPTDIQPGGLSEELQERLRASRNLIVICSPHSAQSKWVGKEIEFFHQLGRTKQIHFFIVDGQPHSGNEETECFNPIVDTLGLPEILAANIHERTQTFPFTSIPWPWMDKQRAYVQLISKLLGVEFDAIWQRHRRLLIQKAIAWVVGVMAVLAVLTAVWVTSQPVDVEMKLNEVSVHNNSLPPLENAIVTMTLDNESKTDTIRTMDATALFKNIPHHYLGKEVKVCFRCKDFVPTDTTLLLEKTFSIDIRRNPEVYGHVKFRLWNTTTERTSPNTDITIDGRTITSDGNGDVTIDIPLAEQKRAYSISSSSINILLKEMPMPCGSDDILQFE